MGVVADLGSIIKKIFIVSEELTRLSSEVKELSRDMNNHEARLAVIENTLSLIHRPSRPALPGK